MRKVAVAMTVHMPVPIHRPWWLADAWKCHNPPATPEILVASSAAELIDRALKARCEHISPNATVRGAIAFGDAVAKRPGGLVVRNYTVTRKPRPQVLSRCLSRVSAKCSCAN